MSEAKRIYENLLEELKELVEKNAPTETIDAIRYAAQVCANVAIGGERTLTKEERKEYQRHAQYH